ncbi:HAD-like domain protein [Niveomyces insectorum RCEF 264]|uniref:HAD-like domain protein n=1 Tax=Niveomyces insectorum RCEF 264 TaxID=1081102 RepID=A0A167PFX3_9HYPO|nr:HAD-like domain protein [Niveomyces insectorum RCEF 264]
MHIVLDFDGTITVDDTIGALAQFAVNFQQTRSPPAPATATTTTNHDWHARWQAIVDAYVAALRAHSDAYRPRAETRTQLAHELAYLRSLCTVEQASVQRIVAAGLFAGLAPVPDRLFAAGRAATAGGDAEEKAEAEAETAAAVVLRPGFTDFLAETHERRGWPVSVVSINWSDAWIRGVLAGRHATRRKAGPQDKEQKEEEEEDDDEEEEHIRIFANTITDTGDIVPNFDRTTHKTKPIASCSDKVEATRAAEAAVMAAAFSGECRHQNDHPPPAPAPAHNQHAVYIGDSPTDLECLVEASGGGIVMAGDAGPDASKLLRALARLGYAVPHVSDAPTFGGVRQDDQPRLAWARDFHEILASGILDAAS